MSVIWVLNGPGLNLLGQRETHIYGSERLETIIERLSVEARDTHGAEIVARQTNHEGVLLDWLCEADATGARAIILNAGGLSHSSIALHDVIRGIRTPVVAVHLSNVMNREEFRHRDYVAAAAIGVVAGFGSASYRLALTAAMSI